MIHLNHVESVLKKSNFNLLIVDGFPGLRDPLVLPSQLFDANSVAVYLLNERWKLDPNADYQLE